MHWPMTIVWTCIEHDEDSASLKLSDLCGSSRSKKRSCKEKEMTVSGLRRLLLRPVRLADLDQIMAKQCKDYIKSASNNHWIPTLHLYHIFRSDQSLHASGPRRVKVVLVVHIRQRGVVESLTVVYHTAWNVKRTQFDGVPWRSVAESCIVHSSLAETRPS